MLKLILVLAIAFALLALILLLPQPVPMPKETAKPSPVHPVKAEHTDIYLGEGHAIPTELELVSCGPIVAAYRPAQVQRCQISLI